MDNKSQGHFRVFNAVQYEPPVISENNRDEWVEYGEDNNYFQFLIDRYVNSPTNNAVINNIVKLIYGKGLKALNSASKPNEYAQMVTLFKSDCLKHLISDLKMLGQCAIQVIYSKDRKKIVEAYHVPVELLRAEKCNEEGEIEAYYFCNDWTDTRKNPPERISAFGMSQDNTEIYYIRPYSVGMKYYSYVDYQGSIPYSTLEEEIASYLINEVQNGFSGTKVINFNNGVPDEDSRERLTSEVINKLTGTKGKRTIVAFNHSQDNKTTVDDIPLNDAPQHYEYLADECMRKIMLGHNVTSPLLFGVATTTGFGSNADELKNSFVLYYNMVIRPYQEMLIHCLDNILAYNDISLKLYFETLKPLEFTNDDGSVEEDEDKSSRLAKDNPCWEGYEMVGFKIKDGKKVPNCVPVKASKFDLSKYGSKPDPKWILIDEYEVDMSKELERDENINLAQEKAYKKTSLFSKVKKRMFDSSEWDESIGNFTFLTRYRYAQGKSNPNSNSRDFCTEMLSEDLVYTRDAIEQMGNDGVNPGWGPGGSDQYDIFLYKGGGNCYHVWNRQTYVTFNSDIPLDVNDPRVKEISEAKAREYGYVINNPNLVDIPPIDMPNQGFLN